MLRSAARSVRVASAGRDAQSPDDRSKSGVPGSGRASIAPERFFATGVGNRSDVWQVTPALECATSRSADRLASPLTFACQKFLEQFCSPLCNGSSCERVGLHGPDADSVHGQHAGDAICCFGVQQDPADIGCTRLPASAHDSCASADMRARGGRLTRVYCQVEESACCGFQGQDLVGRQRAWWSSGEDGLQEAVDPLRHVCHSALCPVRSWGAQ